MMQSAAGNQNQGGPVPPVPGVRGIPKRGTATIHPARSFRIRECDFACSGPHRARWRVRQKRAVCRLQLEGWCDGQSDSLALLGWLARDTTLSVSDSFGPTLVRSFARLNTRGLIRRKKGRGESITFLLASLSIRGNIRAVYISSPSCPFPALST